MKKEEVTHSDIGDSNENIEQVYITPKDIAELDKGNNLTEKDIGFGRRIINKLKELFRRNDNQR